MKTLWRAALVLALAGTAFTGPALSGVARAATWVADPASSKIGFSGTQVGERFQGSFRRFTATISFDPARPQAGTAEVTIDIASAATGDTQRDGALPQAEWFDAAKFPRATFRVAGFTPKGGDDYVANGTLTIRGITANVTLPFKLAVNGDTAHATGHADLLRTHFGVGQGDWASADYVALEVGVDIDLVAHKAP